MCLLKKLTRSISKTNLSSTIFAIVTQLSGSVVHKAQCHANMSSCSMVFYGSMVFHSSCKNSNSTLHFNLFSKHKGIGGAGSTAMFLTSSMQLESDDNVFIYRIGMTPIK